MKSPIKYIILLILLINQDVHSKNTVEIVKQEDNTHTLLFKSTDIFEVNDAQKYILNEAQNLCKDRFVHLNKYEFNRRQGLANLENNNEMEPDTFELTQDISCEDEIQNTIANTQSDEDKNWIAPNNLVIKAEKTFTQYLDLLKKKKYKSAYAMLSKGMKATASYKDWKANMKSFFKQNGSLKSFSDHIITWYKDPVAATEPGIYAAFDYKCEYTKADMCSGVMILHLDDSNEFKVVRIENNIMEKGLLEKIQKTEINIKPHPTANISMQEYNNYYQIINLKLITSKQLIEQSCLEYFADKPTRASFYFTTNCHPAHPAWITLHVVKENNKLHMGQIGYFAGDEPAFAQMFKAFRASTEERRKAMAKENGWD
jgi:hypothetical protein